MFFAYFYTQVSLNPEEICKNIRENGGSIPGIRSEKMEEYLTKILNRIILPGSLYLALIALIPTVVQRIFHFPTDLAYLLGGTSLLILVGVDLDTMSQVEAHVEDASSRRAHSKGALEVPEPLVGIPPGLWTRAAKAWYKDRLWERGGTHEG